MSTPLTSYNEGFLDGWASAYHRGAAVLFGLIWMAEAIRARRRKCPTCRCMLSITTDYCGCCADTAFWAEAAEEGEMPNVARDDEASQVDASSAESQPEAVPAAGVVVQVNEAWHVGTDGKVDRHEVWIQPPADPATVVREALDHLGDAASWLIDGDHDQAYAALEEAQGAVRRAKDAIEASQVRSEGNS